MEFDKASVNASLKEKLQNCNLKEKLIQALKEKGWTDDEISQIDDELNKFDKNIFDDSESPNKEINKEFNNQLETIISNQENIHQSVMTSGANNKASDNPKVSHLDFNSPKEVIVVPEPVAVGVSTIPVNIEDAHYTLKQNYPYSYGVINPNGDWFRVDLLSGKIELVHHSGTHLKIDGDGNVTMKVAGSVKWVVDGDFTMNVRGNSDFITLGNRTDIVGGNKSTMVGGNNSLNVAGSDSTTASTISHN